MLAGDPAVSTDRRHRREHRHRGPRRCTTADRSVSVGPSPTLATMAVLARHGAFTWDDLRQVPDDGFRRKLVDG